MSIDKLSDVETGHNDYEDVMQHLQTSTDEIVQGKLAGTDHVINSYEELHTLNDATLNATSMGMELAGAATTALPEVQDISLHADVGTEHLDGLAGGEDGSIAANLHIIDLSGG